MKKIIYSAMAVAMLATTSCKDDFAETFVGEEATVEFSISTADMNTRAYGDAGQIDHLHYAIYEEDGTITQLTEKNVNFDGSAKLQLQLKTGKTYKAIFWADDENAPYDIDFNAKTMKIDRNSVYMKSNNDMLDAFYAVEEINVSQSAIKNVVLTRPFAQINVGANDLTQSIKANYRPTQSSMSVPVYTTLNLWNGSVADRYQVEYAYNDLPTEALEVNGQNYTYIAMNYVLVDERETIDVTFRHKDAKGVETSKTVGSVPVQRNFRTNLYGSLLTSQQEVNITINPAFGGVENKEIVEVATVRELQDAIANPNVGEVVLTSDIEMSDILVIGAPSNNPAPTRSGAVAASRNLVIDGNGKTLTYTGKGVDARAITVESTANGTNLTLKNLTVNCTSSYCQRGINYNTNGTLKLDGVTVKGTNVTYALNLPGSSDGANVTINKSSLTGNIALNVWGENSVINATNTVFTAVDNNTVEGYAAVKLNNDGTTSAEGTVINIEGGKIDVTGTACTDTEAVSNGTSSGVINISESTVVNGEVVEMVAVIRYADGNSYSFTNLTDAIAKANDGETITLIRDITMKAEQKSGYGKAGIVVDNGITIDGNGKKLTVNDAWNTWDCAIAAKNGTIKNLTVSSAFRGIFMPGANGNVIINNVIFDNVIYTFNSDAGDKNYGVYISNSTLNGWTSHSDVHKEVVYTNCSFGQGNGYECCRPYGPTTFVGCNFATGFELEAIGVVTFENCTIGDVELTAENLATLVIGGIDKVTVR